MNVTALKDNVDGYQTRWLPGAFDESWNKEIAGRKKESLRSRDGDPKCTSD